MSKYHTPAHVVRYRRLRAWQFVKRLGLLALMALFAKLWLGYDGARKNDSTDPGRQYTVEYTCVATGTTWRSSVADDAEARRWMREHERLCREAERLQERREHWERVKESREAM